MEVILKKILLIWQKCISTEKKKTTKFFELWKELAFLMQVYFWLYYFILLFLQNDGSFPAFSELLE